MLCEQDRDVRERADREQHNRLRRGHDLLGEERDRVPIDRGARRRRQAEDAPVDVLSGQRANEERPDQRPVGARGHGDVGAAGELEHS